MLKDCCILAISLRASLAKLPLAESEHPETEINTSNFQEQQRLRIQPVKKRDLLRLCKSIVKQV